MPLLFEYLLKFSISLGAVYLFYILVLQRLTFYNRNRLYLLLYSLLCFVIPFTDISPFLGKHEMDKNAMVNFIPTFNFSGGPALNNVQIVQGSSSSAYYWQWGLIIFLTGSLLLLARLTVQYFSFLKMRSGAELLSDEEVKLYRVNDKIIPFSFNNSIFINHEIENGEDLKEIIRHEFVHVKQKHTIDILFAELLCVINWYNPFAWLIRKAIRQNLEFIADNNVLQSGFDRKQYQYLLLKVMGVSQFSIAPKFNFSSLKKRIAMMNKLKSAKVHGIKFLFALPLAAVLLLAFRDKFGHPGTVDKNPAVKYAGIVVDVNRKGPVEGVVVTDKFTGKQITTDINGYYLFEFVPADRKLEVKLDFNKQGYIHQVSSFTIDYKTVGKDSKGLMELIGMKEGLAGEKCEGCFSSMSLKYRDDPDNIDYKQLKRLLQEYLENDEAGYNKKIAIVDTPPPALLPQIPVFLNDKGNYIDIIDRKGNCTVVVKDKNQKEVKRLLLTEWNKNEKYYENLYGQIPPPPPPPPATNPDISDMPEPPAPPSPAVAPELPDNVEGLNIQSNVDLKNNVNTKIATVRLKNGTKEVYNLNNPKEKAAYKNKYGELPPPPPPAKVREQRAASSNVKNNGYMVLEVPAKPLYIVDGKEIAVAGDLDAIDPAEIARVDVLKDKTATDKYGAKGKNGVVKITTKKNTPADVSAEIVEVREVPAARVQVTEVPVDAAEVSEVPVDIAEVRAAPVTKINGKADRVNITENKLPGDALYYIDDVPATRKQIDALNPKSIQSIDVLKGTEAEKKYGEKGKKGVIKISTKKKLIV
jgi:BlaR1 peptidase M56